jgi:hypothetical protein
MSFADLLTHRLLLSHPDVATTADSTGQLYTDATGQPLGDATADTTVITTNWEGQDITQLYGRVQERTGKWPEGPGSGPELVDTIIFLPFGTDVRELDKIRRPDATPDQVYQVVFVDHDVAGAGHHIQAKARRVPL